MLLSCFVACMRDKSLLSSEAFTAASPEQVFDFVISLKGSFTDNSTAQLHSFQSCRQR